METHQSKRFFIQRINDKSKYLEAVIELGDNNSKTLGFLPKEAYIKHAEKNNILVCLDAKTDCVAGYLLYYVGKDHARLNHLCVRKEYRGKGLTKKLVQHLREKTKHLYGIYLSCRRDYNLQGMWAKLGFTPRDEKLGRGKDQEDLTIWYLDHSHPNLLTKIAETIVESKICAVIDANIFYDLVQDKIDVESKESKALIADWIKLDLELFLTDEIYNEINRNIEKENREKLRNATTKFQFIPCSADALEPSCQALQKYFPETMSVSDESDLRQLARVVGSTFSISFFVTRDKRLLSLEDEIYQEFKILVIRPTDLIVHLDELKREAEYQPLRLASTSIQKQLIKSGNQDLLSDLFLNHSEGERKSDFQKKLRQFLAEPKKYECFIIGKSSEDPLALMVYERSYKNELKVEMFRIKHGKLKPTITRFCIQKCVFDSAQENRHFTKISDYCMDNTIIKAIQNDGFFQVEQEWLKVNLSLIETSSEIASQLLSFYSNFGENYEPCKKIANILLQPESIQNPQLASDLESILWPAKIVDAEIPCFIIPIQAWWAKDLVDQRLTQQTIWGANEELALRREMIYYRNSSSFGLKAPARILWYVSDDPGFQKLGAVVKAIRACSRLEKIVIDSPDNLHRRFRRLGVYNKSQIKKIAKNDKVMAIQFSDIELFENPIELEKIREILDFNFVPQTVKKITQEKFMVLYNLGKQYLAK